jgi:hypothetical protein
MPLGVPHRNKLEGQQSGLKLPGQCGHRRQTGILSREAEICLRASRGQAAKVECYG